MKIVSMFEKLPANLKTFLLNVMDLLIVFVSYFIAIKFEDMTFSLKDDAIQNTIFSIMIMYIFTLNVAGVYKGIIKYTSTKDYLTVGAVAIVVATLFCTAKEYVKFFTLGSNIILLAAILMAVFSITLRVFIRSFIYAMASSGKSAKKRL